MEHAKLANGSGHKPIGHSPSGRVGLYGWGGRSVEYGPEESCSEKG